MNFVIIGSFGVQNEGVRLIGSKYIRLLPGDFFFGWKAYLDTQRLGAQEVNTED